MVGPIDKSGDSLDVSSSEEESSVAAHAGHEVTERHAALRRTSSAEQISPEKEKSLEARDADIKPLTKETFFSVFIGPQGTLTPMMAMLKNTNTKSFLNIVSYLTTLGADEKSLEALKQVVAGENAKGFFGKSLDELSSTELSVLLKYKDFSRDEILQKREAIILKISSAIQAATLRRVNTGMVEIYLSESAFNNFLDKNLAFAAHILQLNDAFEAVNQMRPEGEKLTWFNVVEAYRNYDEMVHDNKYVPPEKYKALVHLPPIIWQDKTRTHLYLNVSLAEVPAEIGKLVELKAIELVGNYLTALPEEMKALQKLKQLVLGQNRFTEFPMVLCQLLKLEWLTLNANQLASVPAEIGNLTSLRHLDLSGNQLTTLPVEIGNLRGLQKLILTGNPITWDALPKNLQKTLRILVKNGLEIEGLEMPSQVSQKLRGLKKRFKK